MLNLTAAPNAQTSGSFVVWNSGTAPLGWTATSLTPWLSVSSGGVINDEKSIGVLVAQADTSELAPGNYTGFIAVNSEGRTQQITVTLNVVAGANIAPQVTLTSPARDITIRPGSQLTLSATATDADGTIARVVFRNGTTTLATAPLRPNRSFGATFPAVVTPSPRLRSTTKARLRFHQCASSARKATA